jgi:hypothetical protein
VTEDEARAVLQRFGRFADQFADCFGRRVQRDAASRYLAGLLNDSERKSMQAMHGRLSDAGTYQALQPFITDSPWPPGPMWVRLRELTRERRGILAVDDTGFPKQGRHSVGVTRQYCGALGKTGNCQVGVTTALIGATRVWPPSCELCWPQEWAADAERRDETRVPSTARCREKWRIALAHVREVTKAGFAIDAVVADADYGTITAFRTALERIGLRYAVAVRGQLKAWARGATTSRPLEAMGQTLPDGAWRRVTWGHGITGPLAARFVARRVRLRHGRGDRWVLFERSLATGERKYDVLNLEPSASLKRLVRLARSRSALVAHRTASDLARRAGVDARNCCDSVLRGQRAGSRCSAGRRRNRRGGRVGRCGTPPASHRRRPDNGLSRDVPAAGQGHRVAKRVGTPPMATPPVAAIHIEEWGIPSRSDAEPGSIGGPRSSRACAWRP